MPNNQDADVTSSSGPVVDVTDDVHDRSDDVVSLDGSIESSISLESIDNSGDSDVHPALDSASHTSKDIPIAARNSKFFIEDELCRFQVGEQYFQVDSHMFIVQSEKARDLLSHRLLHPERPVVLEDVAPAEFEKFLTAVYCNVADEPELSTKEDWTAVLKLSCLFDFASLRTFAIAKLFPITDSVDKIILARDYGMDEWLENAYLDVCMAGTLPSDDDSEALGFSTFRKIARAREILSIGQSSELHETSLHRRAIIADIFSVPRFKKHSFNALDPENKNKNEHGAEKTNALDAVLPVGDENDPQNVVYKATSTAPTACRDYGEDVVAGRATHEARHNGDTGKGDEKKKEHEQWAEEDEQRAPKNAKLRAREKRQQGKLRRRAERAEIRLQVEEAESILHAETEHKEEIRRREKEEKEERRIEEEEYEIRRREEEEDAEDAEDARRYEEELARSFEREVENQKAQELYHMAEEMQKIRHAQKKRARDDKQRAKRAERKLELDHEVQDERLTTEDRQGQREKDIKNHSRKLTPATVTSTGDHRPLRSEARAEFIDFSGPRRPWPFSGRMQNVFELNIGSN